MAAYSRCAYDVDNLGDEALAALLKAGEADCVEVPQDECKLRNLILAKVAKEASCASFGIRQTEKEDSDDENDDDSESSLDDCGCPHDKARTAVVAGLGLFKVGELWVLHQTLGKPQGTDCGVSLYASVVLFAARAGGGLGKIRAFCDGLVEESERSDPRRFTIYRWHLRHQYWRHESRSLARPLESIVLPKATKDRVVDDMAEYLSADTKRFYTSHGVPYRRSYLFYGVPGAGKSSMIAGLAGKFARNVCYLQLCDKDMSDDALKNAVHRVPSRSIVVLEDIDAMFARNRAKKNDTPLTFSGLLNALDGIGSNSGQIFILTTNERENLDDALIRHGRVDVQVEFCTCVPEQATTMFSNFYPGSPDLAEAFSASLFETLGDRKLSTAALQGFFIKRRRCAAKEALDAVADIAKELDERDTRRAFVEAADKEAKAKQPKGKKPPKAKKRGGGDAKPAEAPVAQLLELVKLLQPAAASSKAKTDDEDESDNDEASGGESEEE